MWPSWTPTTHGSIGLTTGLDPAMTLGCGGFGGNITSDNISPKHLLNIKRVAYELRPAISNRKEPATAVQNTASGTSGTPGTLGTPGTISLPKVREKSAPQTISTETLTNRIDRFLATRGLAPPAQPQISEKLVTTDGPKPTQPEAFVCEDDVRAAVKMGRKLMIGERTIVTPAARDAGEAANVFVHEGWRP